MSRVVYFVHEIVPYLESTTVQICRTAAAIGSTIYVRSQMTDSIQHADSTRAVSNTIYVCVACPRYAPASFLCRSLSFVTLPYHTFLLYIRTFKSSNTVPGILDTNQPILTHLIHLRPQRQFFNEYFFCFILRRTAEDNMRRAKNATTAVVGPCARAASSPYTAASCFCHILSRIVLLLPRSQ